MSKKDELFTQLDALELPIGTYAIFAGGPMSVRGLKPFNDLDLVVTSDLFEKFLKLPEWKLDVTHGEILSCGNISMVRNWEMGGWDEKRLVAEADVIGGRPYVRLEEVLKWKKYRGSLKDIADVKILEEYLSTKIKVIIFDVDGVAVDSFDANLVSIKELYTKAGYVPPTREEYKHLFHLSKEDLIRVVAKNPDPEEFQKILGIAKNVRYPIELMKATEGSIEIIENLSKKYRLGIVTGRLREGAASVQEYFTLTGQEVCFETVVCVEDYQNRKPHPESLLLALEKLGIAPWEAIYIGDQPVDLEASQAAGVHFIPYTEFSDNLKGITHEAEKFSDLPRLIEEIEML